MYKQKVYSILSWGHPHTDQAHERKPSASRLPPAASSSLHRWAPTASSFSLMSARQEMHLKEVVKRNSNKGRWKRTIDISVPHGLHRKERRRMTRRTSRRRSGGKAQEVKHKHEQKRKQKRKQKRQQQQQQQK